MYVHEHHWCSSFGDKCKLCIWHRRGAFSMMWGLSSFSDAYLSADGLFSTCIGFNVKLNETGGVPEMVAGKEYVSGLKKCIKATALKYGRSSLVFQICKDSRLFSFASCTRSPILASFATEGIWPEHIFEQQDMSTNGYIRLHIQLVADHSVSTVILNDLNLFDG